MKTVTVLYFCTYQIMTMQKAVLTNLHVGSGNLVILPTSFKEGKTIVAVIEGEANVLNMTGERIIPNLDQANTANEEKSGKYRSNS